MVPRPGETLGPPHGPRILLGSRRRLDVPALVEPGQLPAGRERLRVGRHVVVEGLQPPGGFLPAAEPLQDRRRSGQRFSPELEGSFGDYQLQVSEGLFAIVGPAEDASEFEVHLQLSRILRKLLEHLPERGDGVLPAGARQALAQEMQGVGRQLGLREFGCGEPFFPPPTSVPVAGRPRPADRRPPPAPGRKWPGHRRSPGAPSPGRCGIRWWPRGEPPRAPAAAFRATPRGYRRTRRNRRRGPRGAGPREVGYRSAPVCSPTGEGTTRLRPGLGAGRMDEGWRD